MDNNYYTPDIEDLRIGYECEVEFYDNNNWTLVILEGISKKEGFINTNDGDCYIDTIGPNRFKNIRTPYLTKEQIEKEGWSPIELKGWMYMMGTPSYRVGFKKGNYFLVLDTRKPHIEIVAQDVCLIDWLPEIPESFRITIPCPSINEFRTISKLLEI